MTGRPIIVECRHCSGTYNLMAVETIARYADCTVFKAPCCGRTVDDRRWKSLPDFHEPAARRFFDMYGRMPETKAAR